MSGKKAENGKCCSFRHPKKCVKFCKHGTDPNIGCTNPECRFLHPILCRNSIRHYCCENEKCAFTHLKGTLRNKSRAPNDRNSRGEYSRRQYNNNSRKNFSSFEPRNLGFRSHYTRQDVKKADNNQGYQYQPQDYPRLPTQNNSKEQDMRNLPNESTSSADPNFPSFLDLFNIVQSIQQSHQSLQQEMLHLRRLIPPAHYLPVGHYQSQLPTPQYPPTQTQPQQ